MFIIANRRDQPSVALERRAACLSWLTDPIARTIQVYRPGEAVERHEAPAEVSGEPMLPGFTLKLTDIWD